MKKTKQQLRNIFNKLSEEERSHMIYGNVHLFPVDDYAILRLTSTCPIDEVETRANEIRKMVKENPGVKYCPERNSILYPPTLEIL